jgi:hypothetical protein
MIGSPRVDHQPTLHAARDAHADREGTCRQGPHKYPDERSFCLLRRAKVRPYTWLLNRVGDEGVKLTGAGYLPPAHMTAAMTELGLGSELIGQGNRENQTLPVLHLRESAASMGLLRERHGRVCSRHMRVRCAPTQSPCGCTWPRGCRLNRQTPAKPKPGSFSWSRWPPRTQT